MRFFYLLTLIIRVTREIPMKIDTHPTVLKVKNAPRKQKDAGTPLSAQWLKDLARKHGAGDAGLVEIVRPELADQLDYIRQVFPETRTLLSICSRMNREPVRSPVRSVANQEFHTGLRRSERGGARHRYRTFRTLASRPAMPSPPSPWKPSFPDGHGPSPTNPLPSPQALARWACTGASSTPGSDPSSCWTPS